MPKHRRGRAGETSPARPSSEPAAEPEAPEHPAEAEAASGEPDTGHSQAEGSAPPGPVGLESSSMQKTLREETKKMTPAYGFRGQTQPAEGVTVVGEAVRRASPESAEFLVEISANASTASQALRDHNNRIGQIAQAAAPLGVQRTDIQTISSNVYNLYSPLMPSLPGYPGAAQIGPGGIPGYGSGMGLQQGGMGLQPEVQFGSYQARSLLRVNVRDPNRVGEVVDAITRAGASLIGSFSFRVSDEAGARRAALEAAGKDARAKAETLAQAAGKQVGDPVSITEDIIACNGAYAALRSAAPFAFGAAAPPIAGELEYYARVTASFRLQ